MCASTKPLGFVNDAHFKLQLLQSPAHFDCKIESDNQDACIWPKFFSFILKHLDTVDVESWNPLEDFIAPDELSERRTKDK